MQSALLLSWTNTPRRSWKQFSAFSGLSAKPSGAKDNGGTIHWSPDPNWGHQFAIQGQVRFLKRRIEFDDGHHVAPVPSAADVFRPAASRLRSIALTGSRDRPCE